MIVECGMQPNCSELVIRLNEYDSVDRVMDELEDIGIKEYIIRDVYDWAEKIPTEWDDEVKGLPKIIAIKDLPKKIQKSIEAVKKNNGYDKKNKDEIELAKFGINMAASQVVLLDKDDLKEPNGTIWISEKFDEGGIALVGHQHCNWDMFPLLKKISDHFGEEVRPYDGGSINEYERFLNGEEPE